MPRTVITANRLSDGAVVFLTEDGSWSERFQAAVTAEDEAARDRLLETAQDDVRRCLVVDAYAVPLAEDGTAQRLRERIRAEGPTIAYAQGSL